MAVLAPRPPPSTGWQKFQFLPKKRSWEPLTAPPPPPRARPPAVSPLHSHPGGWRVGVMPPPAPGPAGPQAQTRDWRGLGGMGGLWSVTGLLLPLLEEPELGGEGRGGWAACRDPRPFRVLSLASRERVRGRPQGRRAGGLGLPARPDRGARGGGPSKRETHGGVPGTRPPARRVRMSVTASMSSAGSIAVGKSGGSAGLPPDPRPAPAPWGRDPPTARTGRPHGRDVPHGWWMCPMAGT